MIIRDEEMGRTYVPVETTSSILTIFDTMKRLINSYHELCTMCGSQRGVHEATVHGDRLCYKCEDLMLQNEELQNTEHGVTWVD